MARRTGPSIADIRQVLGESAFSPREPVGIIRVIMQQANPNYYEMRAIELITEGQQSISVPPGGTPTDHQLSIYNDKMSKAISLLALARVVRRGDRNSSSEGTRQE